MRSSDFVIPLVLFCVGLLLLFLGGCVSQGDGMSSREVNAINSLVIAHEKERKNEK